MNFTHFISHHGKKVNTEHYLHLVRVAKIDGKIDESELELLHKEGKRFGLTDPEIDHLIETEHAHNYHPPYSLRDKFEELYNITTMIFADDVVTNSEKQMIKKYATIAGFSDEVIVGLLDILIDGVKKGVEEEVLLKEFKKKYL